MLTILQQEFISLSWQEPLRIVQTLDEETLGVQPTKQASQTNCAPYIALDLKH